MAAIHDLVRQIADPKLRDRIEKEWDAATRKKKFGLVYERHLPELVPIYDAKPKRGDLVALRGGSLSETWRVRQVKAANAFLVPSSTISEQVKSGEKIAKPLSDLVVVKQFGEPIFPTLTPVDTVQNGPDDGPWHALIEADNYHALQLLEYLYAGKVDCIYIDPPYNTGARDWKYNNDYVDGNDSWRHSKWLSFMEKRLRLARKLLKPISGVLICTVDEHEVHHLGVLLEEVFPSAYRQMVTIVITSRGVAAQGLARVEEHALFAYMGKASANKTDDNFLTSQEKENKKQPWASLLRRGTNASPSDRPGLVYPIIVNPRTKEILSVGETLDESLKRGDISKSQLNGYVPDREDTEAWPIRSDGRLGTWQVKPQTLMDLKERGYVKLGRYDEKRNSWAVNYLKRGPISSIQSGEIIVHGYEWKGGPAILEYAEETSDSKLAKTVWHRTLHDAGTYGSSLLQSIVGNRAFDFPKSLYAVKDTLSTIVGENKNAIVVDFFAGSGTTLNAVNLLNSTDDGKRQCILVTNNEVSGAQSDTLRGNGQWPGDQAWESQGICQAVTWPRSKFTILGHREDGTSLSGDYITGKIVENEKARSFRHLVFVSPDDFRLPDKLDEKVRRKAIKEINKKQKALVSMIEGLPQNAVTENCRFIARDGDNSAVLFDPDAVDEWLTALDELDQIREFFIVAETDKQFKAIKRQVEDLLGPQILKEEEKRPMADGFAANLAYFKLDFLDKNQVELGAAFREVLPLLWLKAGAVGPRPELPSGSLPNWLTPEGGNFAVLLHEARIKSFLKSLKGHQGLDYIFIVTDAEEAFRALSVELKTLLIAENPNLEFVQLYRDYLTNFVINTRDDNASIARGDGA